MKRRNFSAEFKFESAQMVLDQSHTIADAANTTDVGLSTSILFPSATAASA